MVEYGVGLEQVEHTQLAGTQRSREVACTPNTTTSQSFKRLSHEIDFTNFDKKLLKKLGKCTPHNHMSTFNSLSEFGEEIPTGCVLRHFLSLPGKIKNNNRVLFSSSGPPLSSIFNEYNLCFFIGIYRVFVVFAGKNTANTAIL
jgi:hypothetical protein